jgi:hypothetical protein
MVLKKERNFINPHKENKEIECEKNDCQIRKNSWTHHVWVVQAKRKNVGTLFISVEKYCNM